MLGGTRFPTFYASLHSVDLDGFKITAMGYVDRAPGFISTSNLNFFLQIKKSLELTFVRSCIQ
jgi:hypothetical protein